MHNRKLWVFVALLALLVAQGQSALAAGRSDAAPLLSTGSPYAIAGHYIVVFAPAATGNAVNAAVAQAERAGAEVRFRYTAALNGFAGSLPEQALNGLRRNPNVLYVEADQTVSADATQSPATWGIDRIDQRNLPLSISYTYNATGAGVTAYIIDTGIRTSHSEFGGRARIGADTVGDGRNGVDCNGHGTHVAGTVGGSTYGVAKGVSLVAVRVLNCSGSGTTSGVIAGIDWVTGDHTNGKAVANMSLGGSASSSLDNAVKNSIADGVTYSVSAGNSNRDACRQSPARVPEAITVGATTDKDARASYSNYGRCLDLFAPGSNITSAWNTSDSATNTISGTSMASPHVTGVAALYLEGHTGTPLAVRNAIVGAATAGVISNPGKNSPNLLLYSLIP